MADSIAKHIHIENMVISISKHCNFVGIAIIRKWNNHFEYRVLRILLGNYKNVFDLVRLWDRTVCLLWSFVLAQPFFQSVIPHYKCWQNKGQVFITVSQYQLWKHCTTLHLICQKWSSSIMHEISPL